MNPPFGTKKAHIDIEFLEVASKVRFPPVSHARRPSLMHYLTLRVTQLAATSIYSLHKSSTRDYLEKKAASLGFRGQVLAEMRYDLPK